MGLNTPSMYSRPLLGAVSKLGCIQSSNAGHMTEYDAGHMTECATGHVTEYESLCFPNLPYVRSMVL